MGSQLGPVGDDSFVPGTRLGKYELIATIGKGGMAKVILARQRGLGGFEKAVVVKVIHPHMAQDKAVVGMLLDEARLAAQIVHQNVVQTYELDEAHGTFYIVMEYLAGESLTSVIRRACRRSDTYLPPHAAAFIVSNVCDGLHAAHEAVDVNGRPLGIIHRDISPGNVVVLYSGAVKIVDFGIAKAQGRVTSTADGELKGKYGYMAPEQIKNEPMDRRSDVFSLGVVLWEALAHRRLFQTDNVGATLLQIIGAQRPPPSSIQPGVPRALDAIALKALSIDPDERFQSAAEMRHAIDDVIWQSRCGNAEIGAYMAALFGDRIEQRRALLARTRHDDPELQNILEALEQQEDPDPPSVAKALSMPISVAPSTTTAGSTTESTVAGKARHAQTAPPPIPTRPSTSTLATNPRRAIPSSHATSPTNESTAATNPRRAIPSTHATNPTHESTAGTNPRRAKTAPPPIPTTPSSFALASSFAATPATSFPAAPASSSSTRPAASFPTTPASSFAATPATSFPAAPASSSSTTPASSFAATPATSFPAAPASSSSTAPASSFAAAASTFPAAPASSSTRPAASFPTTPTSSFAAAAAPSSTSAFSPAPTSSSSTAPASSFAAASFPTAPASSSSTAPASSFTAAPTSFPSTPAFASSSSAAPSFAAAPASSFPQTPASSFPATPSARAFPRAATDLPTTPMADPAPSAPTTSSMPDAPRSSRLGAWVLGAGAIIAGTAAAVVGYHGGDSALPERRQIAKAPATGFSVEPFVEDAPTPTLPVEREGSGDAPSTAVTPTAPDSSVAATGPVALSDPGASEAGASSASSDPGASSDPASRKRTRSSSRRDRAAGEPSSTSQASSTSTSPSPSTSPSSSPPSPSTTPPASTTPSPSPTPPPSPSDVKVTVDEHYQRGMKEHLAGHFGAAVASFGKAIALDPSHAASHRGLGLAHQRLGQNSKAIAAYRQYLALRPNASDAATIRDRITDLGGE